MHQEAQRAVATFLKMAEKRLNTDINTDDTQQIVNSAIPKNIQKATVSDECF